jgi:hypothetical protein
MNLSKLKNVNKDVWLALFVVLPVFSLIIFSRFSSGTDKASGSNCYEQAGKEIASREGNRVVSKADIERYQTEILSRCN